MTQNAQLAGMPLILIATLAILDQTIICSRIRQLYFGQIVITALTEQLEMLRLLRVKPALIQFAAQVGSINRTQMGFAILVRLIAPLVFSQITAKLALIIRTRFFVIVRELQGCLQCIFIEFN